jgi:peptidylprolyl isomerase
MPRLRSVPLLAALAACAPAAPRFPAPVPPLAAPARTLATLQAIEIAPGTGDVAEHHRCVYAHYTGWLTDGTKFDSSRDTTAQGRPREPISVPLGFRRVIPGWDAGFEGLRVGGRRRLIIPHQFAYGEKGRPPLIPARATLVFDIEVMAVADTLPRAQGTTWPRCPAWSEVAPSRGE